MHLADAPFMKILLRHVGRIASKRTTTAAAAAAAAATATKAGSAAI